MTPLAVILIGSLAVLGYSTTLRLRAWSRDRACYGRHALHTTGSRDQVTYTRSGYHRPLMIEVGR